jgi:hypothetical protein
MAAGYFPGGTTVIPPMFRGNYAGDAVMIDVPTLKVLEGKKLSFHLTQFVPAIAGLFGGYPNVLAA